MQKITCNKTHFEKFSWIWILNNFLVSAIEQEHKSERKFKSGIVHKFRTDLTRRWYFDAVHKTTSVRDIIGTCSLFSQKSLTDCSVASCFFNSQTIKLAYAIKCKYFARKKLRTIKILSYWTRSLLLSHKTYLNFLKNIPEKGCHIAEKWKVKCGPLENPFNKKDKNWN